MPLRNCDSSPNRALTCGTSANHGITSAVGLRSLFINGEIQREWAILPTASANVVQAYISDTRRCEMAMTATQVTLDTPAAEFRLPAIDGKTYALDDLAGPKGTVIVFICNHCPYVKAVIDRMVADARTLLGEGFGFAAICSNDAKSYPEDSFANMQRFAKSHRFPFPYLHDEGQAAARAYGAVCTPDFFGYDAGRKLKYRGRLDEGRTNAPPAGARSHAHDRRDRHGALATIRLHGLLDQ